MPRNPPPPPLLLPQTKKTPRAPIWNLAYDHAKKSVFTQLTILLTFTVSYDHLPRLNGNIPTSLYCIEKSDKAYNSSTNFTYARCLRDMGEREVEKEREREREREREGERKRTRERKIRLFCPGCALAFVCLLVFFPFIILVLPSFTVQSSCLSVYINFFFCLVWWNVTLQEIMRNSQVISSSVKFLLYPLTWWTSVLSFIDII